MRHDETICAKHDNISSLADEIIEIVAKAKSDGQRMEDALHERRDEIECLRKENDDLEKKVSDLEDEIEYLKRQIVQYEEQNAS
jgi:phage shock protein A